MRGILIRRRTVRLFALALILLLLSSLSCWDMFWMKSIVEAKISRFLGSRFDVAIGDVEGGILGNLVLQDVVLKMEDKPDSAVFCLDRVEVSYTVWHAVLERLRLVPEGRFPIKEAAIFFSDRNPFVRGFIKLYAHENSVDIFGSVSPLIFGDEEKRAFKGSFNEEADGRYSCEMVWSGTCGVKGSFDPVERELELSVLPMSEASEEVKVECKIDEAGGVEVYTRLYRWFINDIEVVGDLWARYKDDDGQVFSFDAKNLLVDKRPVKDIHCAGSYDPHSGTVRVNNLEWEGGLLLNGLFSINPPYPVNLNFVMKELDLEELARAVGGTEEPMAGIASGNVAFCGPIGNAEVSGRVFVEKGVLGELEFVSMFATLSGNLPVVKISDARVVKDGGHIIVSGEIDFSKMEHDMAMDNLLFETDNKVAVWESWQITKDEGTDEVEARKDRLSFCTLFEGDSVDDNSEGETHQEQDMWFKYKLDEYNSLRMEVNEDGDFLGVEHKVQF